MVAATSDPEGLVGRLRRARRDRRGPPPAWPGARAVTHAGMPVDLRVVPEEAFGNLLQHFTGSGKHNEALRTEAVRRGLHVSEYGIADDESGETHACATEEEVYERLGMQFIPPELRENRGELAAARERRAAGPRRARRHPRRPAHAHVASDGRNTIEEMAEAAQERGYKYVAITDHSASHGFGDDVHAGRAAAPDRARPAVELKGFTPARGHRGQRAPDGSLDYDGRPARAARLGRGERAHVVPAWASGSMTERMVRAMEHPLVDALGHPTGRLIQRREPYEIDIDRVIEAAVGTGTFLEINANPDRRDLNDTYARAAAEAGVTLVIDSDAHGRTRSRTCATAWPPRGAPGHRGPGGEHAHLEAARQAAQAPLPATALLARAAGSICRRPGSAHQLRRLRTASCGPSRTPRRRAPRSPPPRATACATAAPRSEAVARGDGRHRREEEAERRRRHGQQPAARAG